MRIVALCGPKTCGKDTAGRALFNMNNSTQPATAKGGSYFFRHAQMAEGVKNICKEMFGYSQHQLEDGVLKETKTEEWPHLEPRWPMMDIANWLRDKYGGDVHVRRWLRVAQEHEAAKLPRTEICHVMTDLRFPEEVEMLKEHGGLILYIHRPEAEAALAVAQGRGDAMAKNQSEAHYAMLMEEADHIVHNDSTIDRLHAQVQNLTQQRFGHWNYWGINEGNNDDK